VLPLPLWVRREQSLRATDRAKRRTNDYSGFAGGVEGAGSAPYCKMIAVDKTGVVVVVVVVVVVAAVAVAVVVEDAFADADVY